MEKLDYLDNQMQKWSPKLRDDVKISVSDSTMFATSLKRDWMETDMTRIVHESGPISFKSRIDEIYAFQSFVDLLPKLDQSPFLVRAHVAYQNYICFVYLSDGWLKPIKKYASDNSCLKKSVNFILNNPVRSFRNAIAHSNWEYAEDFTGINFWARKGNKPNEEMSHFFVSQNELDFWQNLSRCIAYATMSNISPDTAI